MGMSATHCQGNVREFQSVWRVVTLHLTRNKSCMNNSENNYGVEVVQERLKQL